MTYLDCGESFIAQVKLKVCVSRVVKSLAQTAKTFSEELCANRLFVSFGDRKLNDSTTSIFVGWLLFIGIFSKEISLAADLNDSFDEFALCNLAVIVLVHFVVLRLKSFSIIS